MIHSIKKTGFIIAIVAICLSCFIRGVVAVSAAPEDVLGGDTWALLTPTGAADLTVGSNRALHVVVHKPSNLYYQIELTHDIASAVPAKTPLIYQFWARSLSSSPIHAVIEKRTAPYTRLLDKSITLSPKWTEYTLTSTIPVAYHPRGLAARLQLGQQAGAVDFKNITIVRSPE